MNKTELVKKAATENELTQKAAAAVVDSVFNSVMDSLAAREPVSLFGSLPSTAMSVWSSNSSNFVYKQGRPRDSVAWRDLAPCFE